jgi:hypothetical protein
LAFPAKSFQANTTKLGMAFGRARTNVGTFRLFQDVLRCFRLLKYIPKPNYSGVS